MVNNAGIVPDFGWGLPRWPAVQDMDTEFWSRVIETNLLGTFLCTKHALRHMVPRGSGHILNMHGGGGAFGSPYVVSKDAIVVFGRLAAEQVREAGVFVATVYPGAAIATEDAPEEARKRMPGPEIVGNRFLAIDMLAASDGFAHIGRAAVRSLRVEVDRVVGIAQRRIEIGSPGQAAKFG